MRAESTPVPQAPQPMRDPTQGEIKQRVADAMPEDSPTRVSVVVDPRGFALAIIAVIAAIFALDWAQNFVISLLLGILFAYSLNPLVVWLERMHVPRGLGASLVILSVVGGLALGAYALRGEMQTILDQLPVAVARVSASVAQLRKGEPGTMQKVQTAANEIEKVANEAAGSDPKPRAAVTRVSIDSPGFKVGTFLWAGSLGAVGMFAQGAMVLFLTFFLLVSGDTYRRKLVRISGPALSNRKITVRILDDINASIQRYMALMVATNLLVALLTWAALRGFGLENAGAWAAAAGLLHVIPYLGPAVTAVGIAMAGLVQFDSAGSALLVGGASLAIATLVGMLVTTWMAGRIAKMNTAAVFVALLFWGWLWGIWGMLLSIPIMVIVKVVAQHVEQLEPLADLLGE